MTFESGCRARAHASGRFRGDAIQPGRTREGFRRSRLWIAASLLVTALATNAMAAITVSGAISTDTTWSTGTGPYSLSRAVVARELCALVRSAWFGGRNCEDANLNDTTLRTLPRALFASDAPTTSPRGKRLVVAVRASGRDRRMCRFS